MLGIKSIIKFNKKESRQIKCFIWGDFKYNNLAGGINKMQKKRVIKILLLIVVFWLLFTNLKSYGAIVTSKDGKWEYFVKNGVIHLCDYFGSESTLIIPKELDGYQVKYISGRFENENVEYIKLPSTISITNTALGAFGDCSNLKTFEVEEGIEAVSLGHSTFWGCKKLENIIISSNIKRLGMFTFGDCYSLESFDTKSIEKIGMYCFSDCKNLETINIRKGLVEIDETAFCGCEKLSNIVIDKENKNFVLEENILYDYNKTKIIFYPLTKKELEYSIPATVKELKTYNIENNYLEKVNIHKDVNKMDASSFVLSNSLKEIKVDEQNLEYCDLEGVLFNKDKSTLICYPGGKREVRYVVPSTITTISSKAFCGNDNLKELIIRNTVTNIEEEAFEECDDLVIYCNSGSYAETYAKENEIPYEIVDGVITDKYIYKPNEDNSSCTIIDYIGNETQVTIPEKIDLYSVTKIGNKAFYANENINYIEIHKDIKEIGIKAFSGCINLKNISVNSENLNYISDDGILFNKTKTELICFPSEKEVVNNNYSIPDTVTKIAYGAFEGNEKLRCINFGANVIEIGNQAFSQCKQLQEINVSINSTYESENGVLFKNKKNDLICYPSGKKDKKYEIPSTVTYIMDFIDNDYIEEIVFGENVEFIDISAFQHCENLKNIDMSKSKIEGIKSSTFYNCKLLENIKFPKSLRAIYDYAFAECISLKEIILPDAVEYIGIGAFSNCNSLVNVDLNNITRIGEKAFKECIALKEVIISDSVENVLTQAFSECINLEKVTILSEDIKIAKDTFLNCNNITIHCYKGSSAENFAIENRINYELLGVLIQEDLLNEDTKYLIKEDKNIKYIMEIEPKTIIASFKENINKQYSVEIYNKNGQKEENGIVATNMKIIVKKEGQEAEEYILVVKGDCSSDGKSNIDDILQINKHRLNKVLLTNANLKAGDVNNDGKVDMLDILKINKYRLGNSNL